MYYVFLRQEPERRVLGTTHGPRQRGVGRKTVRKPDEVVEVPLLKSLQQMLNDPAILKQVYITNTTYST